MIEVLKQALEALEQVTKELLAVRDELAERGARPTTNVFHQRLWDSSFSAYTDHAIPAAQSLRQAITELESQEPVAKPYAYEYGRDNGDGTYSVIIDKGDLIQTAPAVYNYVRPQNAHKNWPIKELFDAPPAQPPQRKPLTDEQMFDLAEIAWRHGWASCRDAEYIGEEAEDERWGMIGAEVVQNMAAHGIKE